MTTAARLTAESAKVQPQFSALTLLRLRFARGVAAASILLIVAFLLYSLSASEPILTPIETLITFLIGVVNVFWLYTLRRGDSLLARYGIILTLVAGVLSTPSDFALAALFALVTLAVLANNTAFLILSGVIVLKLLIETVVFASTSPNVSELLIFAVERIIYIGLGVGIRDAIRIVESTALNVQRSTELLRVAYDIGQATTALSDLESLFERVVMLVQDRFGFYHVQIFVVNGTGDKAVLEASTGEIGRRLLARNHDLAVGSQSVIGQVTLRGEPVIAKDTDRDEIHAQNELLINTRSELAVPIRDGAVVVGALDVQSEIPNNFDNTDVQALQVIADFLGGAIRNVNQYEQQTRIAQENRRLLGESEANVREIERLNGVLTGAAWQNYTQAQNTTTGISLQGGQWSSSPEWTDGLAAAGNEGRTVTQNSGGKGMIAVPLRLRGEIIGAIEVESNTTGTNEEAVEMMEAVAQRLAISLENARLYESSRDATVQEQFINSLSSRYQSITSVDELLRLTLMEMGESLGAQHGAIRLGRADAGTGNGNGTSTHSTPVQQEQLP